MRVAIIPARGGSVRIPRKNVRDFMGKPMMQWPIEAAKASCRFDKIIVSTDDQEIAALSWKLDCELHMRQPDDGSMGTQELAGLILDAWPDADEACVIYPCSPMLTAEDLRDSCNALTVAGCYVVSCLGDREDAGCFYWGYAADFRARLPLYGNRLFVQVDPARFIDINTEDDWAEAESMFNALHP